MDTLRCDLVVVGAGMAGMSAATYAAQKGMEVAVLEIAAEVGGSAALSNGYVWSVPDIDALLEEDPGADYARASALIEDLPSALQWLEDLGIDLGPRKGPRLSRTRGLGHGHQIDVHRYMARCEGVIEASNGFVMLGCRVSELALDRGRVVGLTATDASGWHARIDSDWVMLATGGFQANRALLREHMGDEDDRIVLRSNPCSAGGGLSLGVSAGAAVAGNMDAFYGHLVASPLTEFRPAQYSDLSQFHSDRGVLLSPSGARFTDERLGDHVNAQMVSRCSGGLAVLVGDDDLRQSVAAEEGLEKVTHAASMGARVAVRSDLDDLGTELASWFSSSKSQFIASLNQARSTIVHAPFWAVQVQPAITFTYGGLRTDVSSRVMREDGTTVPGLLAAGADAGGLYERGYAGGLSMALVSGLRGARLALAKRGTDSRVDT